MDTGDPCTASLEAAASALVSAWRDGRRIAGLPSSLPTSVAEAHRVQDAMVGLIGPAGGWKVAPLREGDPSCCRLPAVLFQDSPALPTGAGWGDVIAEGEIAVRFGRDLPARSNPYGIEEVADAIATVHPAIEIITSRFADRGIQPPFHALADMQNCGGVVVGRGRPDWRSLEFAELTGTIAINGTETPDRGEWPDTERTLAAVTWLVGHAHSRGTFIAAGDVVITGARLGPARAPRGATVVAGFDGLGDVVLHLPE